MTRVSLPHRTKYRCASCGREIFGRSLCRDCEREAHKIIKHASATPHGVRSMERMK